MINAYNGITNNIIIYSATGDQITGEQSAHITFYRGAGILSSPAGTLLLNLKKGVGN